MYDSMKKTCFSFILLSLIYSAHCQTISSRLEKAFRIFDSDAQLKSALSSLYVIDAKKGSVVFSHNAIIGMSPASTQKIITSATAFELLGNNFRYATEFYIINDSNDIYIKGSGDPTLGSWRWKQTSEKEVITRIIEAIKAFGISSFKSLIIDENGW